MKYTLITLFLCFLSIGVFGQNNENDILAKAIKEEVDRGMNGLKSKNTTPPFFISYTIADRKSLSVEASFGSLVSSVFYPYRMADIRLLMGNNQCTDENFSGSSSSAGYETFDGSVCLENSEEGIRYTIWRDIDALYKSASVNYEEKLLALKQMDIPEKDKNLPDWDKSPAVQMNLPLKDIDFNKEKYEDYVKKASYVFNNYKDILVSRVSVDIQSYVVYSYNTEGTQYRLPVSFVSLSIFATAKDNEEETIGEYENMNYMLPENLPSITELEKMCRELAENVLAKTKASKVAKTYTGPVLFEGYAVVESFFSCFFTKQSPFIAQRMPISSFGYSYENSEWEEKIGERITNKSMTIEDLTGTSEYKGKTLLGYVPIDAEGVVPPQSLVLVEKGVLKNMLSNRVPTSTVKQSNGHQLYSYSMGLRSQTTSGVVRWSDSRATSAKKLKKELLKKAKKEGYDYAYIVRKTSSGGTYPMALYKVSVADGTEELVRSATINNLNMQSFKNNIVAVSDEEYVYNGFSNTPISVIVPNGVLFEELEIQKEQINKFQKTSKVPAPYAEANNE